MIEHEKYGKFDKISNGYGFRESDHAYIDLSTGKRMTSVTTVIGTFQPVFDTEKKSLGVAKREVRNGIVKGVTVLERQQQLKKQWKDKNHKVSSYGTHLHYVLETMLVKKMSVQETLNFFNIKTLGDSEEAIRGRHEKKYIQFVHDLNLWDYDELICEDLLSSRKWGLSGQSDVVGIKNNKVYIRDWKFNSKMLSWDGFRGERFHFPLSHYETGKLRTYQLQGSIYMYLKCLQTGLEPGDIIFYHFLNGVITEHRLEYLEEEVYRLLEFWYWKDKIPKYGHVDLIEGRMGIDLSGNIVQIKSVKEDKCLLQVGKNIDWFSLDVTRKIMCLPPEYK